MIAGGLLLMAVLSNAPIALPQCPDKPNCVSTQATDARHAIAPIRFEGTPADALAKLSAVIASMPRTRIVARDHRSIRAEFTTRIFRFVDDAIFVVDEKAKVIHFRSASRVGHSDLGVNRKRMETVRELFAKK